MSTQGYFTNYGEWHEALTVHCGIVLTPDYANQRIAALQNDSDATTMEFVRFYGDTYRRLVVTWFQRSAGGK